MDAQKGVGGVICVVATVALIAWLRIDSALNNDGPAPVSPVAAPIAELRANIGKTAYNRSNGMEIGVVTGVTTSVIDYADRPDKAVPVYEIRRGDRVIRFSPGAVTFNP